MIKLKFYMYTTRDPHTVIPPHYHNHYELVYYFSGYGKVKYNPTKTSLQTGNTNKDDFLYAATLDSVANEVRFKEHRYALLAPQTVHNESHGEEYGTVLAIGFDVDETVRLQEGIFTDRNMEVRKLLEHIRDEYEHRRPNYNIALNAYVSLLVAELTRNSPEEAETSNALELTKTYIDNYYMTGIGIADLAEMAHYSVDHFRKLFHEEFGISPKSYINSKRLERANDLLLKTDIPLSEIPEKIGFGNSSQFSVFYKAQTGTTPNAVRKKRLASLAKSEQEETPEE